MSDVSTLATAPLQDRSDRHPRSRLGEGRPDPEPYPDPFLTASLYCRRNLDQVAARLVLPWWREVAAEDTSRYLWTVRYSKGGEHLKLRLHGRDADRLGLCQRLGAASQVFFAVPGAAADAAPAADVGAGLPALDAEDDTPTDHPDRTLLWTTYRRSHISLGAEPLLRDDRYAALMTRCLGAACERALAALAGAGAEPVTQLARQAALWQGLLDGLAALTWSRQRRAAYLSYHRDWLLRFTAASLAAGPDKAAELLSRLEAHAARSAALIEPLRQLASEAWQPDPLPAAAEPERSCEPPTATASGCSDLTDDWRQAMGALRCYFEPPRRDTRQARGPSSDDATFPPVFKVLHGFANQLGLQVLDEAFAHHLLLDAMPSGGVL